MYPRDGRSDDAFIVDGTTVGGVLIPRNECLREVRIAQQVGLWGESIFAILTIDKLVYGKS